MPCRRNYHRLDMTIRRPYVRRWGTLTLYLQVLNVYNQRNVLFYFFNYDKTHAQRHQHVPAPPQHRVEASF
jgi:hypothetical protein